MKKGTMLIVAVLLINSAFSQAQKDTSKASKSDTVWVDLSKAKVIAFRDSAAAKSIIKLLPAEPLAKAEVVWGFRQYWYTMFRFARTSKNPDFSPAQVDELISPFATYAQQYEYALQQAQQGRGNQ